MELVTGFAGQAHVNPIDMAHVNAVAFGHDAYLLDTQNKLKPTLATANKLVVDTGDLMIQGHHFTVVQSEEIALQSGISGQKRNALVCARYNKASGTGIETASWVVKYGTATTGTPADPNVTTGNILDGIGSVHEEPIFRIEYNGITPGNPILLVPEFQSNAKFRTSIVQMSATKQNVSLPAGSAPYAQVVFNFNIPEGKKIIAITSIQVNRPAACAIASFSQPTSSQLEVWYRNVLGVATTITISVSVLVM